MNKNQDNRLCEDIGYLKGKVEDIDKKLDKISSDLASARRQVSKHDVIFGKIGVAITAGIFILATAINFFIDWIKTKLGN
jgi:hypothetical protein